MFHRGAPPPRNPDVCRRASPKTRTDCKNCRVSNGTSLRECGRREMVLVHDSLRPHDRDTSRFFSLRFPGWAGATGFRASEQRSSARRRRPPTGTRTGPIVALRRGAPVLATRIARDATTTARGRKNASVAGGVLNMLARTPSIGAPAPRPPGRTTSAPSTRIRPQLRSRVQGPRSPRSSCRRRTIARRTSKGRGPVQHPGATREAPSYKTGSPPARTWPRRRIGAMSTPSWAPWRTRSSRASAER